MLNQTRYQLPRSLGLEKITPTQGGHIRLHLGFTARTQKLIKTDEGGLHLLKYLFKPKTINEIAKKFSITKNHTKKICKNLSKLGVLN
ncbi:MAG: hypothetical protein HY072_03565, partial [Deltaproteobacteria bacterium]|nr:hypothetical protein [Deltaproteobacteria bacterium]